MSSGNSGIYPRLLDYHINAQQKQKSPSSKAAAGHTVYREQCLPETAILPLHNYIRQNRVQFLLHTHTHWSILH